ncbi:hypothetical protein G647_08287 [Cladophialophora carrionii CBS 160.54]|uniref:Uncharacterized protein n=1 Tax=Cladophialophora carrionii CBS 160.54 TaxID=1279043 RepID=V9D1S9_9EURO|nr:uncharacterized protein G647_08287 [Cladophialophora carrionii CBS 160.54]ETI20253.1 hypothetical protein G647_08287 [Cladophialophora carrionii CBS 160.54]
MVWERTEEGEWKNKTTLLGHTHSALSVLVTRDQKRVVSASWNGTVRIWNLEKGQEPQPSTSIKTDWVFYKMWFPWQSTDYVMTPQGA